MPKSKDTNSNSNRNNSKNKKNSSKRKEGPAGFELGAERSESYQAARKALAERIGLIRARRVRYTKRLMPGLAARAADAAAAKAALEECVEAESGRFLKPRTREFHGVRVGLRKKAGKLVIADEARTVELIREKLPRAQQDLLLVTTVKIQKQALRKLRASDLAAVGASIGDVTDSVTVTVPKDSTAKLAEALRADFKADGGARG